MASRSFDAAIFSAMVWFGEAGCAVCAVISLTAKPPMNKLTKNVTVKNLLRIPDRASMMSSPEESLPRQTGSRIRVAHKRMRGLRFLP